MAHGSTNSSSSSNNTDGARPGSIAQVAGHHGTTLADPAIVTVVVAVAVAVVVAVVVARVAVVTAVVIARRRRGVGMLPANEVGRSHAGDKPDREASRRASRLVGSVASLFPLVLVLV